VQDCWDSSGREMERGADILTEKKHGGQCGYCHTDFEIEVLVYVQERTLKGKFKQEMLICPECVKKIEGKPRYSIEELKAISEHLINEGRIEGQAIKGLHDLAWFISKNPEKVKQILEAN